MVIIPSLCSAFIHIPKTGGTALSQALVDTIPDACWLDSNRWMHAPANEVSYMVKANLNFFTIIREPKDIFASNYRWAQHCLKYRNLDNDWFKQELLFLVSKPFSESCEAIARSFGNKGFIRPWTNEQTTVFKYEEKPFEKISELLGVNLTNIKLNDSPGIPPVSWTRDAEQTVEQFAWYEYEYFYKKTPQDVSPTGL